jgi:hypothetical protein
MPEDRELFSFITCTLRQIIRMIRSRRMRWAGYVALMGGTRIANRVLLGN